MKVKRLGEGRLGLFNEHVKRKHVRSKIYIVVVATVLK